MRRRPLLPLVAISASLVIMLAGCTAADDDAVTTPPPAVTTEDDATTTDPEDEAAADEGADSVPLPDTWPAEVPVIDGIIVDAFFAPSTPFWGARVLPDVPLEQADAVAPSIMEAAGFEVEAGSENDDGTTNLHFINGAYTVVINISLEPGEEGVLYNVRPR